MRVGGVVVAGLACLVSACSSSTAPRTPALQQDTSSPDLDASHVKGSHPTGTLDNTVQFGTRTCGAAISKTGLIYVALIDASSVATGQLATEAFHGSIPVGFHPCSLLFTANGSTAFLTNQDTPSIGVISTAADSETAQIPLGESPLIMRLSPNGKRLYASGGSGTLFEIDTRNRTVATSANYGVGTLMGVAVSSNGSTVYTAVRNQGTVFAVDGATLTMTGSYHGGVSAQNVALSRDGKTLYVTDIDGGVLRAFNVASHAATDSVVFASAPAHGDSAGFGPNPLPFDVRVTTDGRALWVTLAGAGQVVILDRATLAVTATINVGGSPRYIIFDASGSRAVVTNDQGWVSFFR